MTPRAPVWTTTARWRHGGDGRRVAGGEVSGKGRMEAIMTEYYHCVGLDGRHVVKISTYLHILWYCTANTAQARKALDHSTPNTVSCGSIEHFCMGSSIEGSFLLGRVGGMHMELGRWAGCHRFFNVDLEWRLSARVVFFS